MCWSILETETVNKMKETRHFFGKNCKFSEEKMRSNRWLVRIYKNRWQFHVYSWNCTICFKFNVFCKITVD